jgi:hypothetical protein
MIDELINLTGNNKSFSLKLVKSYKDKIPRKLSTKLNLQPTKKE